MRPMALKEERAVFSKIKTEELALRTVSEATRSSGNMEYGGGVAENTRKLEQALHWRRTGQEPGACHGFCSFCCGSYTNTPEHCETNFALFDCLLACFWFCFTLFFFAFVIDFTFISKKQNPVVCCLRLNYKKIYIFMCLFVFSSLLSGNYQSI